jgi:hypothetical protein
METYNTGVEKFKSFKRHVSRWVKNPVDLVEQYYGKKFSKDFFLHLISYFISLNGFLYGFFMTQSNILLLLCNDYHRNNSKDLSGDNHQNETTLTSEYITILYIGALVGAFFSFPFVDNFGRKKTLIAALVFCLFMIFWTLITISSHNLYYSRFFMGISLGFMMTIAPLYIAEVRNMMFFSVPGVISSFSSVFSDCNEYAKRPMHHFPLNEYHDWKYLCDHLVPFPQLFPNSLEVILCSSVDVD